MENRKQCPPVKENRQRQAQNLALLTGWWHNNYYYRGVIQHRKDKAVKILQAQRLKSH